MVYISARENVLVLYIEVFDVFETHAVCGPIILQYGRNEHLTTKRSVPYDRYVLGGQIARLIDAKYFITNWC